MVIEAVNKVLLRQTDGGSYEDNKSQNIYRTYGISLHSGYGFPVDRDPV